MRETPEVKSTEIEVELPLIQKVSNRSAAV